MAFSVTKTLYQIKKLLESVIFDHYWASWAKGPKLGLKHLLQGSITKNGSILLQSS